MSSRTGRVCGRPFRGQNVGHASFSILLFPEFAIFLHKLSDLSPLLYVQSWSESLCMAYHNYYIASGVTAANESVLSNVAVVISPAISPRHCLPRSHVICAPALFSTWLNGESNLFVSHKWPLLPYTIARQIDQWPTYYTISVSDCARTHTGWNECDGDGTRSGAISGQIDGARLLRLGPILSHLRMTGMMLLVT